MKDIETSDVSSPDHYTNNFLPPDESGTYWKKLFSTLN